MDIAIVGYGRMGRMIHSVINEKGRDKVSLIVDPFSGSEGVEKNLDASLLRGVDVAIDFSAASAVADNIECYAEAGCPAVIGTTGWDKSVLDDIDPSKCRIIHSGNFSIGVAMFLSIVSEAARLADIFSDYDISLMEIHHRMKADHPSGTALMAAERILSGTRRKTHILTDCPDGRIGDDALLVSSIRTGSEPGTHTMIMDSTADTIEITHRARSREGFARGAVMAAEWLTAKVNGIYTMDDLISDITGGNV